MTLCLTHWRFDDLRLDTEEVRLLFLSLQPDVHVSSDDTEKPARVTAEITPMCVEGYLPKDWGGVEALVPEEFHRR